MKIARSMILGEHVDAASVDYADLADFQIVCPCCVESVYKVVRPLPDGRQTHFFSHRQQNPEQVSECELRVGSMSAEDRRARDAEARGQSMQAFRSVLRTALEIDLDHRGIKDHRKMSVRLLRTPLFEMMHQAVRARHMELHAEAKGLGHGPEMASRPPRSRAENRAGLMHHMESPFRDEMLDHLFTEQGKANYRRLFAHAVLAHTAKVHRGVRPEFIPGPTGRLPPLDIVHNVKGLWHPNKDKGMRMMVAGCRTQNETTVRTLQLASALWTEIDVTLSEFPYRQVAANLRQGQTLHHGLDEFYAGKAAWFSGKLAWFKENPGITEEESKVLAAVAPHLLPKEPEPQPCILRM